MFIVLLSVFWLMNWVRHSFSKLIAHCLSISFSNEILLREITHFGVNLWSFFNINSLWSWLAFTLILRTVSKSSQPLLPGINLIILYSTYFMLKITIFKLAIGISNIPSSSTLWSYDFYKISTRSAVSNTISASYVWSFTLKLKLNKSK